MADTAGSWKRQTRQGKDNDEDVGTEGDWDVTGLGAEQAEATASGFRHRALALGCLVLAGLPTSASSYYKH
jgi:hypothetical protein